MGKSELKKYGILKFHNQRYHAGLQTLRKNIFLSFIVKLYPKSKIYILITKINCGYLLHMIIYFSEKNKL